jgi:hypothetical protein
MKAVVQPEESRNAAEIHRSRRCLDCGGPIGVAHAIVCAACTARYSRDLAEMLIDNDTLTEVRSECTAGRLEPGRPHFFHEERMTKSTTAPREKGPRAGQRAEV